MQGFEFWVNLRCRTGFCGCGSDVSCGVWVLVEGGGSSVSEYILCDDASGMFIHLIAGVYVVSVSTSPFPFNAFGLEDRFHR